MTGRIQQVAALYRAEVENLEASALKSLEAAYNHVGKISLPQLQFILKQLGDKQKSGEPVPLSWLYDEHRLRQVLATVMSSMNHFGMLSRSIVAQAQQRGIALGVQAAAATLQETVPHGYTWAFGRPHPQAISEAVAVMQPGSPLYDLFHGFGDEAATEVKDALVTGVTLGSNPKVIARNVEQALGIARSRSLVIARTEALRAYRSAQLLTFQANDDVVDSWIWQSALSKRTCAACIAMSGTEHPLSEPMESHPCCRCSPLPKTKPWSYILRSSGYGDIGPIPDTNANQPSGADWFADQDTDVQKTILGPKYDGWKAGDFTLDDVVGKSYDKDWGGSIYEKSLKELSA